MIKVLKYLNRRQWSWVGISVLFIVGQVWLDLKMPDYMSAITTLVQTEGSAISDILMQGGYIRHADKMSFTISVRYHRGPPFLL